MLWNYQKIVWSIGKLNLLMAFLLYLQKELKKTLRDAQGVITYGAYTYHTGKGKQTKHKDSSDSTPDRPNKRKMSRRRSRKEREERRAHRKLEKLKSLELDEEVHNNNYSFLYTFGSESDYKSDAGSEEDIDLPESSDSNQQENINACRCRGDIFSCESVEFYKLQSLFEDLNINTITSDNMIELLKEVTNNNLREKIIQLVVNNNASSSKNIEKTKNYCFL
ncbi:hypothetical protein H5410_002661 [Solanum commersonii]|uniref:Uncharacterized protein n=1 Tax=Solanum commersonii TaxID=4109 RepID=A0A9J6B2S5_SOLCO|nr:hypothetical protein H5410_002661 [Solanum commersonii]